MDIAILEVIFSPSSKNGDFLRLPVFVSRQHGHGASLESFRDDHAKPSADFFLLVVSK